MRLAKSDKKYPKKTMFFTWFLSKIKLFPCIGSDPPYIRRSKTFKKRWWGIRVFRDFLTQIPVYGTPKTTKIVVFRSFWTPPKIIKNRLNFAHSKVCEKSRFWQKTVFFLLPHLKSSIYLNMWFSSKLANFLKLCNFARYHNIE